jgi:hypothetical protein
LQNICKSMYACRNNRNNPKQKPEAIRE